MKRQTRTFVVVALAIVMGALASFAVYRAVARIPVRQIEVATKFAVVAAEAMPVGTRVTRESVKVVAWPEKTPLPGGFAKVEDVVDRGLVAAVVENEPIIESKLAPANAGAGLPPTITPGMRAVSVKVNEVIGVAGFVVPGTHVDVVTVMDAPSRQDTMSRIVASDVLVLSAGTRYDQEDSKEGKAIRSTVVTLMVSPIDAQKIALVQAEGQLQLTLRHPLDVAPADDTPPVWKAALFSGAAPAAAAPRPAAPRVARPKPPVVVAAVEAPAVTRVYVVETIRAAKRSEDTLK
jgi:pilus assembly protein CpaB